MKEILSHEINKIRNYWWVGITFIFLMVSSQYVYTNYIDGVYINRVIEFTNGTDPMTLATNKESYCPGEKVYIELSFCKTRDVYRYESQWWLSNGSLIQVRETNSDEAQELPTGCYPVQEWYAFTIPENTKEGVHFGVAVTKHWIYQNRFVTQNYKTSPFYIESNCNL